MPATRDQMIDAFERQVARYGYAKATVEGVASELGISKKTIYEHFPSKAALYGRVVERLAEDARREMQKVIACEPTHTAMVHALAKATLGMARAHIEETGEAEWMQEYAVAADAFREAVAGLLHDVIAGGRAAGEFRFPDVDVATRLLARVFDEYVVMLRQEPELDVDEAIADAVTRFLG